MSEISDEKINRALAEFMDIETKQINGKTWYSIEGFGVSGFETGWQDYAEYTTSLDSLVPIVKKLKTNLTVKYYPILGYSWVIFNDEGAALGANESPSKALALTCYNIIKERT